MMVQISLIFGSIFWSQNGAKIHSPAKGPWGPAGCATEREDLGGVQNCKRTLQERTLREGNNKKETKTKPNTQLGSSRPDADFYAHSAGPGSVAL